MLNRPYHSGLCQTVIDVGKRGGSTIAMAQACDVPLRTLHKWRKRHPAFAYAYDLAKTYAQAYWEGLGKAHIDNPNFNYGVWVKFMSRFPDYLAAPRTKIKHVPKDDASVTAIERVVVRDQEPAPPE